jgi:hypothetical protein
MSLQPLLSRDRYTDEEWALSKAGLCNEPVEFGNGRGVIHCKQPTDPKSFYRWCTEHDEEAREQDPRAYGR